MTDLSNIQLSWHGQDESGDQIGLYATNRHTGRTDAIGHIDVRNPAWLSLTTAQGRALEVMAAERITNWPGENDE